MKTKRKKKKNCIAEWDTRMLRNSIPHPTKKEIRMKYRPVFKPGVNYKIKESWKNSIRH